MRRLRSRPVRIVFFAAACQLGRRGERDFPIPRSPDPFSLVEAALPTLISVLTRIGRKNLRAADLDDVLGETLLKLLIAVKRSHHRRPIANLAALANTILNRQPSNLRRAARAAIVVNSIGPVEPVASLDTTEPQDAGHESRLSRPLALPGRRQRIIVETILAGGSAADAAAKLSAPKKEILRIIRGICERAASPRTR